MNPSQCVQPEQLFGTFMHAGGWPKLGWIALEEADEVQTCWDESGTWH